MLPYSAWLRRGSLLLRVFLCRVRCWLRRYIENLLPSFVITISRECSVVCDFVGCDTCLVCWLSNVLFIY